jgi:hypothetical protein
MKTIFAVIANNQNDNQQPERTWGVDWNFKNNTRLHVQRVWD